MASIGHAVVGMAAGRWLTCEPLARRWHVMALFAGLSLLPDLDIVAFAFGIPYSDPFGHRGASHSLVVAAVAGLLASLVAPRFGHPRRRLGMLVGLTIMSHGLLDTLTDGGLGVALLWPFSPERFFAPWRPLPVAPLGARFLSAHGLHIALAELVWFLPLLLYACWPPRTRSPS